VKAVADPSAVGAPTFAVGQRVRINGKKNTEGEIVGPPTQAMGSGTILYLVKRPSNRADPNKTGINTNAMQVSPLPASKLTAI
jgi:hypothetical protein